MRVRLRFRKLGKVRFTSHRDVARMWERALRRAELPVAATEGFNPRAKVHFGLALPTGYESLAEYLDVDFRDDVDVAALPTQLTPLLPAGVTVDAAEAIPTSTPSLQQAVTSCTWSIEALGLDPDAAEAAVAQLLASSSHELTRERKGRDVTDDIRPYVVHLAVDGPVPAVRSPLGEATIVPAGVRLDAELATQPRGLRPSELLEVLGAVATGRAQRDHQWITTDGARCEPLAATAPSTAPTLEAAS